MRSLYILAICLFSFIVTAQENLSKEEKDRREKNVQAGNPFKQFGYKGKVATLSKGKYLEVHDLDSIVTIGSIRFHVDRKEIVGTVEIDTAKNADARPIGDIPSRWLCPDPLSEEFSNWSPYNFCYDNPVRFIDPDGRAAIVGDGDFEPTKEGHLKVEKGDTKEKLLKQYNLAPTDKNYVMKEGDILVVNNNVTRAIERSNGGTVDEINNGSAKPDRKNDNYVCDEAAQMANTGEEITPKNAEKYGQFPNPMKIDETPGYTEVQNLNGIKNGQGIISIGGQHTVSYYGTSNDGTVYVFTKNGREAKPEVAPLSQVISSFNANQGTNFTTKNLTYYKEDAK